MAVIDNDQFAAILAGLMGLSSPDTDELKAAIDDWNSDGTITDQVVANKFSSYFAKDRMLKEEWTALLSGPSDGGPLSDGYYPAHDYNGNIYTLPSYAKLSQLFSGIVLKGTVANLTILNALTGMVTGDTYFVTSTGHLHSRTAAGTWDDVGPPGAPGTPGAAGAAGTNGTNGTNGAAGDNGWSPVFAAVNDGTRRVLKVIDWVGGAGTKPAINKYVGASGLEALVANGLDIRGPAGNPGLGTGDMVGANNLGDVTSAPVSRDNLGLGTAAILDTGLTSGDVVIVQPSGKIDPSLYTASSGSAGVSLVATGAVTQGHSVALNSDGTVSVIQDTGDTGGVGTSVAFTGTDTYGMSAVYDPVSGKVVVAYRDAGDSDKGKAVVGTVVDLTITFGTPVQFDTAIDTVVATYDVNASRVVLLYSKAFGTNTGYVIAGLVSGTSITFGTAVQMWTGGYSVYMALVYDASTNKSAAFWGIFTANTIHGRVISLVGSAITLGSVANVATGIGCRGIAGCYDSVNSKCIFAYGDTVAGKTRAFSATTTSGTFSANTAIDVETSAVEPSSMCFATAEGRALLSMRQGGPSRLRVLTCSGSTIGVGPAVDVGTSHDYSHVAYNNSTNRFALVFRNSAVSNHGSVIYGYLSGTTPAFPGSPTVIKSATVNGVDTIYVPTINRFFSSFGTPHHSVLHNEATVNSNAGSFVGFAAANAANAANVVIQSIGDVTPDQTGLTPKTDYYVNKDGGLSSVSTGYAKIGRALTASKLLVTGIGV